jgi:hypothetical protein
MRFFAETDAGHLRLPRLDSSLFPGGASSHEKTGSTFPHDALKAARKENDP